MSSDGSARSAEGGSLRHVKSHSVLMCGSLKRVSAESSVALEEKRTVINMLKLAGENCERLLTERIHNVKVQHSLELDEVWTYAGCKQKCL
jgi:hypothetical protein